MSVNVECRLDLFFGGIHKFWAGNRTYLQVDTRPGVCELLLDGVWVLQLYIIWNIYICIHIIIYIYISLYDIMCVYNIYVYIYI